MAYGTIKVDQVTFTNGGVDQTISVSGIVQSISGDITATGTIQGATIIGTSAVSGATVTGNTGNFTSGVFVNVSGTTISGDTGQYTTLTGGTATFTSGIFALGTSGTPSLSFSGDVDTGIYSPGGNQLAISTNGTGALFIDENGNVGIGAAAASGRRLHVQGAGFQEVLVEKTDATTGAILLAADSGLAGIYTRSTVADSTAIPLALHTGNTERLRITSDGTVNIKGAGTAGVTQAVSFSGSAPVNSLVVQATTGNVGLGTSSPGTLLHASTSVETVATLQNTTNAAATRTLLRFSQHDNSDSIAGTIGINRAGANAGVGFEINLADSAGAQQNRLTILEGGNVGIGTMSPGAQLEISNTGNVRIYADAAGGYIEQTVSNLDSLHLISSGFVKYQSDPQNDTTSTGHIFECDGSEKARIDSSGRLLVGTSITPPAVETIVPQIVSSSATQADRAQDVAIYNFQNASGSGRLRVGPKLFLGNSRSDTNGAVGGLLGSSDLVGAIRFAGDDGAKFLTVAEITCEMDGVPGTDDMPGKLIFSTTADGASSPTERMTIKQTGAISCYQTGSDALVLRSSQAAGTTNKLITALYSGTGVDSGGTTSFIVYTNGNVVNTNNSYGQITSDERFKQDIIDAPSQWDDIKAVRLTKYRWKSDPTGDLLLGPIAQELQSVSPGLVDTRIATAEDVPASGGLVAEGDEVLGFKASILYMKAVGALQEAMERIEILEAKVAALEAS